MSTISTGTTLTTAYTVTGDTTGKFVVQTGASATTAMTIDTSQNVGIGTTSPSAKLDVGGTIWSRPGVSTGAVAILTADATSGANGISLSSSFATGGYGPIIFNTSNTERMRIDASGNVGIGTTSPGTYGNAYTTVNAIKISDQVTTIGAYYQAGVAQYGFINVSDAAGTTAQPLIFSNGSNTERMRIDSSGNIGIGTTGAGTVRTYIKGASASSSNWALYVENSTPAVLFFVRNDGLFRTGTQTFSPYNYTTGSAANVFVNTDGDLQRSTSSLRYKTDITDATHGLADVLKLRSVTYKGKNDGDTVFGGLIAEEVHDAGLTEFVAYDNEGRPDALHYGNMVALLTKAIQELKAENDALKTRIEALESK